MQKSLPSLASQIITQDNLTPERKSIFTTMSDPQWWVKSIVPSYAISKADTKDLAMISKDLDSAATRILSFTINAGGQTKESALDHVRLASQFFRSGGAYLQLKTLLNGYESETIGTVGVIQSKLTQTQVNQKYYQERIKTLEELLRRFPNRSSINTQLIDSKESGSKYLPVENQLITANIFNFYFFNTIIILLRGDKTGLLLTTLYFNSYIYLINKEFKKIKLHFLLR